MASSPETRMRFRRGPTGEGEGDAAITGASPGDAVVAAAAAVSDVGLGVGPGSGVAPGVGLGEGDAAVAGTRGTTRLTVSRNTAVNPMEKTIPIAAPIWVAPQRRRRT